MKGFSNYCHDLGTFSSEKDAFRKSSLISVLPALKMYLNLASRKANGKKPFPIGFGYQIKDGKIHNLVKKIESGIETSDFQYSELAPSLKEAADIVKETEQYIKM